MLGFDLPVRAIYRMCQSESGDSWVYIVLSSSLLLNWSHEKSREFDFKVEHMLDRIINGINSDPNPNSNYNVVYMHDIIRYSESIWMMINHSTVKYHVTNFNTFFRWLWRKNQNPNTLLWP